MSATTTPFERITERLRNAGKVVRTTGPGKAMAQCPAHKDHDPSLSITALPDRVLLWCFPGCDNKDIVAALGLRMGDLYNDRQGADYHYPDGTIVHRRYNGSGKKKIWQDNPTPPGQLTALLNLEKVKAAVAERRVVWLVGGEDDMLAVEAQGEVATCARGGEGNLHKADLTPLYAGQVICVLDRDKSGVTMGRQVTASLQDKAASLGFMISKVDRPKADVSDHLAAGYTMDELLPITLPTESPVAGDGQAGESGEQGRWVNLDDYLNGTHVTPPADLGAEREDGIRFLYPGRWHTVIGLTTAGKTTFALWQVKAVLEGGGHVVYVHFEEASPAGIIHRLKGLGVGAEAMRKQLHWGHVNSPWQWGEMAHEIEQLTQTPALAVLDGINAACGQHGWAVKEPESVGMYRAMFVHPLASASTAVLSLGHPPKAVNRQGESYSYGAAGWLNDVDGVGYRMTASKTPISKGASGSSALHVVKDRYGDVQRWGEPQTDKEMPWWYMGQFVVDDRAAPTVIHMTVPAKNVDGVGRDKIDTLADQIIVHLRETTGRFQTVNELTTDLRARGVHVTKSDMAPALQRLANHGAIEWPEVPDRKPRPGWLADPEEE